MSVEKAHKIVAHGFATTVEAETCEFVNFYSPAHITIDPSEITRAWQVLARDTTGLEISHYPESLHMALLYVLGSRRGEKRREQR